MEIPHNIALPNTYDVYRNLGYWFMLLLVLVCSGFYTTYLSVSCNPKLLSFIFILR